MLAAVFALGLAATPPTPLPASHTPGAVELTVAQLRRMIGAPQAAAGGLDAAGYALSCSPPAAAQTTCGLRRTVGDATLRPTLELGGRIQIRDLRLEVVAGRIDAVSFHASADDYDAVQRLLSQAYGAPKIVRGEVRTPLGPRDQVSLLWGAPNRPTRVVDPAPPELDILVNLHG